MSEKKNILKWMKKILQKINICKYWRQLSGGWKGAATGLVLITLFLFWIQGYHMLGTRGIPDYIIGSGIFLLVVVVLSGFITLIFHWIKKIPSIFIWIALASFSLVFICFIGPIPLMFIATITVVISFSVAGMVIWRICKGKYRQLNKRSKVGTILLSFLSLTCILVGGYWLFQNGDSELPMLYRLRTMKATGQYTHSLDDPSEPGEYEVKTLTYGSANSYRKEFNTEESLITSPVDGSEFVKNWSSIRTKTFGFGPDQMPLNGTVWYPDAEGTFPLVIAVHGNHLATDYSDSGYAYLGNLLASKGYIFVSIDENFLNTSPFNDLFMIN
jgi:hypothetical protein